VAWCGRGCLSRANALVGRQKTRAAPGRDAVLGTWSAEQRAWSKGLD